MRDARKYSWLLACALAVGVAIFFALREPASAGKRLSQWVEAYVTMEERDGPRSHPDPADAIRRMGTKAIPYLLRWIRYETPQWKANFYGTANAIIGKWNVSLAFTDQSELRAEGAKEAFSLLGAEANAAAGELGRLANDPKASRATAERAVAALGYIGKEALACLLDVLKNNKRPTVRASAAKKIEDLGPNALPAAPVLLRYVMDEEESVAVIVSDIISALCLDPALTVPVWTECLQDSRFYVRSRAILCLQKLGDKAGPAVPSLLKLLDDNDEDIRAAAFNALECIEPGAVEKLRVIQYGRLPAAENGNIAE